MIELDFGGYDLENFYILIKEFLYKTPFFLRKSKNCNFYVLNEISNEDWETTEAPHAAKEPLKGRTQEMEETDIKDEIFNYVFMEIRVI